MTALGIISPAKAPTHPQPAGRNPQPDSLHGIQIVPASIGCFYPPAIEGPDLLRVNFDCRQFIGDALYLVEAADGGLTTWRGARRFQRTPLGLYIDQTGAGDFHGIQSVEAIGLRIVGMVLEVYRPARRIAELAAALRRAA